MCRSHIAIVSVAVVSCPKLKLRTSPNLVRWACDSSKGHLNIFMLYNNFKLQIYFTSSWEILCKIIFSLSLENILPNSSIKYSLSTSPTPPTFIHAQILCLLIDVVCKLSVHWNYLKGLLKHRWLDPDIDSVYLKWNPRICLFNKFPVKQAAAPETSLSYPPLKGN